MSSKQTLPAIRHQRRFSLPLARELRDPLRPGALHRIWSEVDRQTEQRAARFHMPRWVWVSFAVSVCCVGAVLYQRQLPPGPLLLADGRSFSDLELKAGEHARELTFGDGSSISLSADSHLVGVTASDRTMVLSLIHGTAQFSIKPGGPRRWTIVAQPGRVEVVGTEFTIASRAGRTGVSVTHGTVHVFAPTLAPEGELLSAGHRIEFTAEEIAVSAAATGRAEMDPNQPQMDNVAPAAETELGPEQAPQKSTAARTHADVQTLLSQADAARSRGQFTRAVALLGQAVTEYPGDARTPLAAFTRGVLQLERLARADQALASFRSARSLGASNSLRQDCYLREIEAALALGDRAQALHLAASYRAEFPAGRHTQELTRLLKRKPRGGQ